MAFEREPGNEMDDYGEELSSDYQEEEEEGADDEGEGDVEEEVSYGEVVVEEPRELQVTEEPEVRAPGPKRPAKRPKAPLKKSTKGRGKVAPKKAVKSAGKAAARKPAKKAKATKRAARKRPRGR